jgi:hypothetical protein
MCDNNQTMAPGSDIPSSLTIDLAGAFTSDLQDGLLQEDVMDTLKHNPSHLLLPIDAKTFDWDSFESSNDNDDDQQQQRKKKTLSAQPDSLISLAAANRKPAPPKKKTPLPIGFQPSDDSILCGRGKDVFHAVGTFFSAAPCLRQLPPPSAQPQLFPLSSSLFSLQATVNSVRL